MPTHFNTPQKAAVKGALKLASWLKEEEGIRITKQQIAKIFDCHPNTVNRISKDTNERTVHTLFPERRPRKQKKAPPTAEESEAKKEEKNRIRREKRAEKRAEKRRARGKGVETTEGGQGVG
ncbi:hypothetical protein QBC35DRAFT_459895, partial [Podospora australis]